MYIVALLGTGYFGVYSDPTVSISQDPLGGPK